MSWQLILIISNSVQSFSEDIKYTPLWKLTVLFYFFVYFFLMPVCTVLGDIFSFIILEIRLGLLIIFLKWLLSFS